MENQFELVDHLQVRHVRFLVNRIGYRQMHVHSDFELALLLEGKAILRSATSEFAMKPGDIVFVNSYESHGYLEAGDGKDGRPIFLIVQISTHFLMDYYPQIRNTLFMTGNLDAFFDEEALFFLRRLLLEAGKDYFKGGEGFQLRIVSRLGTLLSLLLDKVPHRLVSEEEKTRMKRKFDRVQRFLSFVDENYAGKIRLADIAEREGISIPHLSHIFTESFGVSFQQYVNSKRLQKAILLMQDSKKNLTNIAFESGFSDPKYMNRLFRKCFGCTPRQYPERKRKVILANPSLPLVQREEILEGDSALEKIKDAIGENSIPCDFLSFPE